MKTFIVLALLLFLISPHSVRANQSDFEMHLKKGNSYSDQRAWDSAIAEYQHAIKIAPNHAQAHYNLALAYFYKYMEVRDKNLKKEVLESLVNPKASNSSKQGKIVDGEDKVTKDLNAQAVREWKRTAELDDSIGGAHYFLGTHYHNIGNLKDAEKELKKAIELSPRYSNSYSVLASVYEKMDRLDLAITYHKKTLEIDPDSESNHYDLLVIYLKLGKTKEAKQEYDFLKSKKSIFLDSVDKSLFEKNK